MLAVDVLVNIYLTAAFVIPVWRSKWNKAQRLALNSSIAAMVALITSFANIVILTVQHGHQLSWVCLGSCGLDGTNPSLSRLSTFERTSSHKAL